MSDIALDTSGDIDLTTGDLQILTGIDAIAQHVKIGLGFVRGEWFLDSRVGVPYFERIFVKNPQIEEIRGILIAAAEKIQGVDKVRQIELQFDNLGRALTVTNFSADTVEGVLEFTEPLILEI